MMTFNRLLLACLVVGIPSHVLAFQLEETTITKVQTAIKNHELTCEQLVLSYLDRIKQYDLSIAKSAPINAITEINRSALNDAQALDAEFNKTQQLSGPLHCVTMILKDNIDTFDTTTTSGSFALLGNQPVNDAFLTARLRKAGAIILAKGGMDEFAWGMTGINSRNGRIGNAYNASKNPGGSSGGPAAAVSANFAIAGIGSDNSGSVRIPAVFNGLVGLRPSTGLISQSGLFPMGKIDGVAGPMTRTVADLAKILDVIAQPDPQDAKTQAVPRPKTYTAYLNENGLHDKRIGIVRHVGSVDTFQNASVEVNALIEKAFVKMQKSGASFIDIDLSAFDNHRDLNQAGEIQDINNYLSRFPGTRKNFQDICESNRTRNFGSVKKCLQFMNKIKLQSGQDIKRALAIIAKNKMYVERIMMTHHLDALFIPISTHGVATYDALSVNTWRAPVSSNAGMPSIAFVIGYLHGMPVGVELVGKQYAEPTLIEMAYAYEIKSPSRQLPIMPVPDKEIAHQSIAEFNNSINQIGQQTYEKILKTHGNSEKILTPTVFQRIVRSILQ